jgi:isoleucyl-tRNA synthetase
MFKPVPSQPDFIQQEHDILRFWEERRSFERLRQLRADAPLWSFIDGPITANNPMGVHHGWGRTYKDLFHRFKAMQGYRTRYQNGYDCQGLWVEVEVERERGFKSKRDIESFGLAEFVLLCKQRVLKYAAVQTEQSIRLGYWMDWDSPTLLRRLAAQLQEDPFQQITLPGRSGEFRGTVEQAVGQLGSLQLGGSYFTFSDDNNYTIWAALKSCFDRGWIYKGRDVMPWCGRCGTGLSQHEIVTEGYQELTHPGLTLRFPLKERPGEALLVWTTTPWTLTSNVAAAVGPELTYLRVRQGDQVLYLSKGSLRSLRGGYEVLEELRGQDMLGWTYTGPFDELPAQVDAGAPAAHRVIPWEGVGQEEGTGIVHIAPGAGAEDYQLGREFDLPVIAPLDESGTILEGFGWLTGMPVRETAQPIYADLQKKGLAYSLENYRHRYPVCWRCGEELVFRLVDEWFISMGQQLDKPFDQITAAEKDQNLRYQIMEVVLESTAWHPSFGLDRELDWLRNMHDWMISKKRYWGLALPIYECGHCGEFEVLGSREQLRERAVAGWEEFDGHAPHRPYIDAVRIACRNCGEQVRRIPDVGNPWLDAGVVGMSTLGYNSDRAHWEQWFPADLISESFPGQFRNWFYSLLAMSTILERKAPFRNVFSYATLLAEDGRPMHKSWGNAIEFNEAADRMGVDVMRWQYCDHQPEKDLLFGFHRADEVRRQFLLPLWNVYSFFVTYANLDGWTPASAVEPLYRDLDRWLLARLQEVVEEVTDRLEAYEPDRATAQVSLFLDHLSNWYLRRSRRRFWAKAGASRASDADKEAAYRSLYQVLVTLTRLLAPFVPFATEAIHQNLVRSVDPQAPESVHHTSWPVPDPAWRMPELTAEMALVMRLASLGHAARNQSGLKLRQPLSEAALAVATAEERQSVELHAELIADELNVKQVRLLNALTEAARFELKPLPKQLGQRFGARFPAVRAAVLALPPDQSAARLLAGSGIEIELEGETIQLSPEEVEVRMQAKPGFAAASEGGYLAALDIRLTPELELEGLAREFIRRVQELRKQEGLAVEDRIRVQFVASPRLAEAIDNHREHVQAETLTAELTAARSGELDASQEQTFDGQTLRLRLHRA